MGFPTLDGPASLDVDEDLFMVDRDPFGVLVGGCDGMRWVISEDQYT